MAQQTAVEWLINQLSKIDTRNLGNVLQIHEQAKQMEMEQHYYSCVNVIEGVLNKVEKGEKTNSLDVFNQYYNETYGK